VLPIDEAVAASSSLLHGKKHDMARRRDDIGWRRSGTGEGEGKWRRQHQLG
jgi:hypothetical protein